MLADRYYVLIITRSFLLHCRGSAWGAANGIWVGIIVTGELADLLILGIILLRLTPYALSKKDRTTIVVNTSIMGVLITLFVPFVVITSGVDGGYPGFGSGRLLTSALDLAAAYYLLLLCAAAYTTAVLLFSVMILRRGNTTVIQSQWRYWFNYPVLTTA
jgi:hypothetical protein